LRRGHSLRTSFRGFPWVLELGDRSKSQQERKFNKKRKKEKKEKKKKKEEAQPFPVIHPQGKDGIQGASKDPMSDVKEGEDEPEKGESLWLKRPEI